MRCELTRCEPWTSLVSLQGDVRRVFGECDGLVWAPPIDVEESREDVVVKAELPGMTREDVKVQAQGDTLVITGERRHEADTKDRTFHRVERAYGTFQRSLTLPVEVDGSRATATYEHGVLTIRLPKSEAARPRDITIDVK